MKIKSTHILIIINVLILLIFLGLFSRITVHPRGARLRAYLNMYYQAYSEIHDVDRTEKHKLFLYNEIICNVLENYPNVMGVNDPTILDKHVPLFFVLASPENKFMGIIYADGNIKVAEEGSRKFYKLQAIALSNSVSNFSLLTKEELKESLMQTIMSSSETNSP